MRRSFYVIGSVLVIAAVVYYVVFPAVMRASIRRVYAINCSHNMRTILRQAVVTWPDEQLPSDFVSMSNLLDTPKLLFCSSDGSHRPAASWAKFTADNCSYVILAPGIRKADTNTAFLRCSIHGFVGYADGRLLDSSSRLMEPKR